MIRRIKGSRLRSYLHGAGRTFDLGGQIDGHRSPVTPELATVLALYLDWLTVGKDMHQVLKRVANIEHKQSKRRTQPKHREDLQRAIKAYLEGFEAKELAHTEDKQLALLQR